MIKFTAPKDRVIRVNEKVNDRVNKKVNERVTDPEEKVLQLLSIDPGYTVSKLAEKLSVSRKTIAAHLKKLKEKGIIERVGSARSGYWKIRK